MHVTLPSPSPHGSVASQPPPPGATPSDLPATPHFGDDGGTATPADGSASPDVTPREEGQQQATQQRFLQVSPRGAFPASHSEPGIARAPAAGKALAGAHPPLRRASAGGGTTAGAVGGGRRSTSPLAEGGEAAAPGGRHGEGSVRARVVTPERRRRTLHSYEVGGALGLGAKVELLLPTHRRCLAGTARLPRGGGVRPGLCGL